MIETVADPSTDAAYVVSGSRPLREVNDEIRAHGDGPSIEITGNAGWGIGEALAAGRITVHGNAGMSLGASMRGGLVHVRGNAGPRCGIALKGGDIVVEGNVGAATGFMAHAGRIICLGDAGESVGDSLWGGSVWVAGEISTLGVDAKVVDPDPAQAAEVEDLLAGLGLADSTRRWNTSSPVRNFGTSSQGTRSNG